MGHAPESATAGMLLAAVDHRQAVTDRQHHAADPALSGTGIRLLPAHRYGRRSSDCRDALLSSPAAGRAAMGRTECAAHVLPRPGPSRVVRRDIHRSPRQPLRRLERHRHQSSMLASPCRRALQSRAQCLRRFARRRRRAAVAGSSHDQDPGRVADRHQRRNGALSGAARPARSRQCHRAACAPDGEHPRRKPTRHRRESLVDLANPGQHTQRLACNPGQTLIEPRSEGTPRLRSNSPRQESSSLPS